MKWFNNLKIGTKLLATFIIVALLAGVVGIVGIINIKKEEKNYTELYKNFGIATANIGKISTDFNSIRAMTRDILLSNSVEDKKNYSNQIKDLDKDVQLNLKELFDSLQTEKEQKAYTALNEDLNKYDEIRDRVINMAIAGQDDEALTLFYKEGTEPAKLAKQYIDELFELKETGGVERTEEYSRETDATVYTMLTVVVIAVIVAVLLGIFISRLISVPVNRLVIAAEKIADGDLNVDVKQNSKDEIGMLASAFKRMSDNLNDVISSINSAAEQVSSGSRQVSDSSVALSQGATEQASSIEELTASLEEISAQTKLNAENATQASNLAENVKTIALKGNQHMKEMLNAMDDINDSSSNISKIIKVIDEIAFQTNILALNAAVEAARAGQHGKGFAVVAEEVRNLAARSANAAKETTDMIEGSIHKVEGGTKIANETAEDLELIVDGIAKAADLVGNIAEASNEQAAGIEQINQGIMQVSQVIQANSATSEESAAASEELSSQAELLSEQVERFILKKVVRSTDNYRGDGEINPEILKVLNKMSDKNKNITQNIRPKTIDLSDNEFGKY
ncbi:methyl-accepting chemotaxis protein [Ruminiclostridium cellulolyticum]|uniref:Methyl-accepting chemotaxis sensory transducer n=1 Tax=Ruminiclostridium cellulolyticum (strain ATCC 35319 / DSM 5812 / JCM 6584 / H10) TaxID=394503 RepID=B8I4Z5_RUMCH|nr:methyl-accepting chemotaxis protein [Ruminiclostridium cellulolyticum]ACL76649.1 methyl-accepting chemotaxis sensory transducer [Ruminiclostridium cellulolyticum H10]